MSDDSWADASSGSGFGSGDTVAGSADEHVEAAPSFLERLMASITGILVGFGLVGAAGFGLFWNEGRAVETARALSEGAGRVVTVAPERIDPARTGQLIHITGPATTRAELRDGDLGIATRGLRLVRKVEMYQWDEDRRTETRDGQRVTVYNYRQVWSDRPIDSSSFRRRDGHQNPRMPLQSRVVSAQDATVGAFALTPAQIGTVSSSADRAFSVPEEALGNIAARLGPQTRIVDGRIIVGADEAQPRVGDVRITYSVLPEGQLSVVGRQTATGFDRYQASNGREVFLVTAGERSAAQMFDQAQADNRVLTWIIRIVGLVVLWIGFLLIFGPFAVIAEAVPLVGGLLAAGVSLAAALFALVVGVPVIALAWLWFRPIVAGLILAGGTAGVVGLRWLASKRKAAKMAAQPAPRPSFAQPAGVPFIPAGPAPRS